LDEVGDMTLATQVKTLRVLEEREFLPVGATAPEKADVRFVCATNKELGREVEEGRFRQDLFFRLNVIPIHLPPLRERKEDIHLLAGHFLAKHGTAAGRKVRAISEESMETLMGHDWPGNIRELENTIQRAATLCEGERIEAQDLFARLGAQVPRGRLLITEIPDQGIDLEAKIGEIEKSYIEMALGKTGGNLTKAAELLGVSFRSIRYKAKKYGIQGR
jgi:DNA-binding NtrC family response regulator